MMFETQRLVQQVCVLLFAGFVSGLPAQTLQDIDRPLRTQRPVLSDSPISHSSFLIPHSSSLLITPDALEQPLTRHYIARYSNTSGILWLNSVIKNGNIYLPYIKEEISRRGLPPELAYLPFIESGYIGTARSKSGAVGLWQFMMNSIPAGMKVNDMIDERRDFRKSTAAALTKLEENYRTLGNWPLALAAYNAGLGAVSRAVQRVKTSDYWTLCEKNELKTETIHYVPKLLAVSYILSRPRQFGLDYWPETTDWTLIKPGRQASLDLIASETGTDRNLLHRLNLELLHGITPADKNYELKIPSARAEMIAMILEKEDARLLRYYHYQIRYGDTLSALSRYYGISLDLIEQHNPGILKRYLKIGETIIIPAFKDTSPYNGGPYNGGLYNGAPQTGGTGVQPSAAETFGGTHIVSKGDTLWSLAARYGVDPQTLASENDMELDQILSIGKVLKVPIIE